MIVSKVGTVCEYCKQYGNPEWKKMYCEHCGAPLPDTWEPPVFVAATGLQQSIKLTIANPSGIPLP